MGTSVDESRTMQYLYTKASLKRVPLSGSFELLPLCNLSCRMCYVRLSKEEMDRRGRMHTAEEWLQLADEASQMGMLHVLLTGGEPLLYPGFRQLYTALLERGHIITVNTNATLIDEEYAEFFRQRPPFKLNITLYGASDQTYYELCGAKNMFGRVTRAIDLLTDAGIPVKINLNITPQNVGDIEQLAQFVIKRSLPAQFCSYMIPPVRVDASMTGTNDRLTPEQTAVAAVEYDKAVMDPADFLTKAKNMASGVRTPDPEQDECLQVTEGDIMRCRAGKSSFWITWDGKMNACGLMDNENIDVFGLGFKEAWARLVRSTDAIRLPVECVGCDKRDICIACAAMCHCETGSTSGKPEFLCRVAECMQKQYGGCLSES